jgi:hypothetical protein
MLQRTTRIANFRDEDVNFVSDHFAVVNLDKFSAYTTEFSYFQRNLNLTLLLINSSFPSFFFLFSLNLGCDFDSLV